MLRCFRTLLISFLILGQCAFPIYCYAWSSLGHQVVAATAYDYMLPETQSKLHLILGSQSIEKAATWPDAVKNVTEWKHAKPYHYKNLPKNTDYLTDLKNLSFSLQKKGDVVRALLHAEDVLVSPSTSANDKLTALRFFIHLIADLHQPLHVGYLYDYGGNSTSITWEGSKTNLHAVWDRSLLLTFGKNHLPQSTYYDPEQLKDKFKTVSSVELVKWANGSYLDWFNESIYYRDEAYQTLSLDNTKYYIKHASTLEDQLHKAGYRLAKILDQLFSSTPKVSIANIKLRKDILAIIGQNETDFNISFVASARTSLALWDFENNEDDGHDDCHH